MKIQRPPLKLSLPIFLISLFAILSFAATVTTTTTTLQGQSGILFNVAGGFTAASNGYLVVQSAQTANATCAWTNLATCNNGLTAGHWEYSLTLTINTGCPTSTLFTITVQTNTGTTYSALGTRTVTSPASIVNGQTMTFLLDTGTTSFTAPVGIVITVA